MESPRRFLRPAQCGFAVLFFFFLTALAAAQSPYGSPYAMRGGLDLAPSNPFGMPGGVGPQGSNSIYLNSEMFKDLLPLKGNLEFGYLYQFNENISTSRFTFDGLLPARTGHDGAAFGEFHGEFVNFGNTLRSLLRFGNTTTSERGVNDRIDLSFGGGYRKIFRESLLLGVNGFYDTSRLWSRWYGSAGVGVEMAALGAGSDLIDLNFNFYGNLFQGRNSIVNAFRNGPGNFDVEVGYSLEIGDHGPDLRIKLTGYQFDVGSKVWGWNGGAEVTSRNGMFSVKAEAGRDRINRTYYTVGGYLNVGLQLENLALGESPFTAPEPIFSSPRNLRRLLTRKTRRNWHQPTSVVLATAKTRVASEGGGGGGCPNECACPWGAAGPPGARLVAVVDVGTIPPNANTTIDLDPPYISIAPGSRTIYACDQGPDITNDVIRYYITSDAAAQGWAYKWPKCVYQPWTSNYIVGNVPVNRLTVFNDTGFPYCAGWVHIWVIP